MRERALGCCRLEISKMRHLEKASKPPGFFLQQQNNPVDLNASMKTRRKKFTSRKQKRFPGKKSGLKTKSNLNETK